MAVLYRYIVDVSAQGTLKSFFLRGEYIFAHKYYPQITLGDFELKNQIDGCYEIQSLIKVKRAFP